MKNLPSRLEELPNEIFHELKSYLSADELFNAFYNLNSRINAVLLSIHNLYLEIRSSVDIQRRTTQLFNSRIVSVVVPEDSDAVAVSVTFPHLRSLIIHRPIRLTDSRLSSLERITLNLSKMRIMAGIFLCQLIFSDRLPSLRSFHLIHEKVCAVGHWRPLINSICHPSPSLVEFIVDIRPTIQWNMFTDILNQMPHLERLIIRKLNTRNQWTLFDFAQKLKRAVPLLKSLSSSITCLGSTIKVDENEDYRRMHPLFVRVTFIRKKSRELTSTVKISSKI